VWISKHARKEIRTWPAEVKQDLGALLLKLQNGASVGYPDLKPFSTVAKGVSEVRLRVGEGVFRVFYLIQPHRGIVVFHAFVKKTQKTPLKEIKTARARIKTYLRELDDESEN
jgi:phage-related protein